MRLKPIAWLVLLVVSVLLAYIAYITPWVRVFLITWSLILTLYVYYFIRYKDG